MSRSLLRLSLATKDCVRLVVVVFGAMLSVFTAMGQAGGTGGIQGTVVDASGAVIVGATVTATKVATNAVTTQSTTSAGFFSIPALTPGEYTLTIVADNFEKLTQTKVIVDALASVTINPILKPGGAGETVTVTADPPALDLTSATLGTNMRNEMYTALPLAMNGTPRDPTAFIALVPGVQAAATQAAGTNFASFNGGQPYMNEVYVEGIPLTNASVQGETRNLSLGVSVEAVDQFQVETNNPRAMYQGQGIENFVMKTGGNRFHGSAYEFFRNTVLDANNYFNKVNPAAIVARPVEKQNQFGGNVSGPVWRDRVFFYAGYDGYYYRSTSPPALQSVPTLKMRNGDFSELSQTIYDPNSTVCNSNGTGCTRTAFAGNVIPGSRLSAASRSLAAQLPAPTNSGLQNNYLSQLPIGLHNNNTTDKLDLQLSSKHRISALYTGSAYITDGVAGVSANTSALPLPYTASRIVKEYTTLGQVHDTYTLSPSLLNQLTYSFNRLNIPILSATADGQYPTKAGIAGLPSGQASNAFPTINFTGPNSPISWAGTNSQAFDEVANTYVLQDAVQWVKGKHSLNLGGQVQWLQDNYTNPDDRSLAVFNFTNSQTAGLTNGSVVNTTGNAYASYLLGSLDSASITENSVRTVGARYKDYAVWADDTYQVMPKLTLSLGLRWDYLGVFHEAQDRMSFLDPTLANPAIGGRPGALRFAGDGTGSCNCSTPVRTHYKNFGPRLGFSYQADEKTVFRGGFAVMYAHGGGTGGRAGGRNGLGQLGFQAQPSFVSAGNGAPAFYWTPQAAVPVAYSGVYAGGIPSYQAPPSFSSTLNTGRCVGCQSAGAITYGDPDIGGRPPYFMNWSFGLQRAFTNNLTLTMAYSASAGRFLATQTARGYWQNQIDPRYMALQEKLTQPANSANLAAANAIVPGIALPYANFNGTIGQGLLAFPQYSAVSDIWGDVGNSSYHSLQLSVTQRLSKGLAFTFNYTWSKEIDNVASTGRTAYNQRLERSIGNIDRPHVISANFTYHLPFGKGASFDTGNRIANSFIGGWDLSGLTTLASGAPLAITSSACNVPYSGTLCVPNYNPNFAGQSIYLRGGLNGAKGGKENPSQNSYLNVAAFSQPAGYTYGNIPRNYAYGLRQPIVWDQDITVRRSFDVWPEKLKFIFAVDAFNVFNTTNFGGVTTNVSSASFGAVTTQANSPRKLQANARFTF